VTVKGRVSSVVRANPLSAGYLDTKRLRMGHLSPSAMDDELPASQTLIEIQSDAE
jgi:hypothetical protein